MNWIAHRRLRRTLAAFVDDELDRHTATAVRAHLRWCWTCSADAELMQMIKRALHTLAERQGTSLTAARLRRFAADLTHYRR